MGAIAYRDDIFEMGRCFLTRDDQGLRQDIIQRTDLLTFYLEHNGEVYGYQISANKPLTSVYGSPFFVVKFCFSGVTALHSEEQYRVMNELCGELQQRISNHKGYYNLRIPAHIVDLIKGFNDNFHHSIFCGGTVEQIQKNRLDAEPDDQVLKIFFGDPDYVRANQTRLIDIAQDSFQKYQGQYHISPVTEGKAASIYSNWVKDSLENLRRDPMAIAEYEGIPIAFCTTHEQKNFVEGVLSAVDDQHRQYGAYKGIIRFLILYAQGKDKHFVTSTQFDNYIVQGVWNSLGLRPCFSIYNFHINNL